MNVAETQDELEVPAEVWAATVDVMLAVERTENPVVLLDEAALIPVSPCMPEVDAEVLDGALIVQM